MELNQEDINLLNISITCNEIGASVQNLPKEKVQDLMDSAESTRPLKKN
jgi:hypothetical protein